MIFSPIHRTYKWYKTRKRVKKRDGNKCAITGETKNLEVHHIESAKSRPDLAHVDNNCITLASWIHKKYHIDYLGGYHETATRESWETFVKIRKLLKIDE